MRAGWFDGAGRYSERLEHVVDPLLSLALRFAPLILLLAAASAIVRRGSKGGLSAAPLMSIRAEPSGRDPTARIESKLFYGKSKQMFELQPIC
jgi:hypothetical protein